MISPGAATIVLSFAAAAILVPLVLKALARRFPPDGNDDDLAAHRGRNRVIECVGAMCFIAGMSVPFGLQGTGTLPPTISSALLVFSSAIVCTIGGMRIATSAFRDGPASFLTHFARKCGVGRSVVRSIARSLFGFALATILVVLITR